MKKLQETIRETQSTQSTTHTRRVEILLGCCLLLALIPSASANDLTGNVSLMAGNKQLNSDDWQKLDSQDKFGVMFDIKRESWPVSFAFDILAAGSSNDNPDAEYEYGYTVEQHLGVRKIWSLHNDQFHPYVGGGLALIHAGLEQEEAFGGAKDDDQGVGGWIGTGAYWSLTEHVNVGLDIRYSQADVTLFDKDYKAGGTHTALTLGYHW